jgi:pimeloyl-ACP methyl ester carboxylesterase
MSMCSWIVVSQGVLNLKCLVPLIFAFSLCAVADTFEMSLNHDRKAVVVIQHPPTTKEWIVFLPGSDCGHYDPEDSRWIAWSRSHKSYGVLSIDKAGMRVDGTCSTSEFHWSARRQQRIDDVLFILNSILPSDAKIILFGESEGGYIAPDVAKFDSRVKALILLSAGTRSWIEEELKLAKPSQRPKLTQFFQQEVLGNLSFDKFYEKLSYAQLNSYDTNQTYLSLASSPIPVLMINGARDRSVWISGVRQDVYRMKNGNISSRILPGANHSLECADALTDPTLLENELRTLLLSFFREHEL